MPMPKLFALERNGIPEAHSFLLNFGLLPRVKLSASCS